MKTAIDLSIWKRKVHFDFFNQFDDPSFEITFNVDVTKAFQKSQDLKYSFFLLYLHASMKAINSIEEFKIRIEGDQLFLYDTVHAGPTIARDNGTFGFSQLPYFEDFEAFMKNAQEIIKKVKEANDLNPSFNQSDVVYYTSIPWISFTGVKHPIFNSQATDSIPKISFGKYFDQNGKKLMPVSVQANHALLDGFHVGKYLETFQLNLDS